MRALWKGGLAFAGLLLLCGLLLAGQSAFGQEIFGQIAGTVTDASGAVVVQATVTITNEATNVSETVTTDERGEFIFTRVLTGTYDIRVGRPGFRTYVQKGITVSVAKASRADVKLEVGPAAQIIVVTENVKQVETTSIQLSAEMPGSAIVNLPLVGRDWIQLARTLPGVTAASADRFGLPSISGGRTQSNNYLINGIDFNDQPLNTPQVSPSPDSIAEFRIVMNTMNPEYSRNSSATLIAITKSGTNNFHGDAFEFHRDIALNAKDFFAKSKSPFNQNLWGGTVGGPIYKNHTFFFFSYAGRRQGVPQDRGVQHVPTPAERSGIINRINLRTGIAVPLAAKPVPFPVIGAPNSSVCANTTCPAGTLWRDAFPLAANGTVTIPTANFNPISVNILNFYPLPAPGTNTFSAVGTQTSPQAEWSSRIDQNWSKDQIYGYFAWRRSTRFRPFSFTGGNVPGFGDAAKSFYRQVSITHVHTFNPSTINEFRIGYNRLRFLATFPQTILQPSALGFTGINPQHPEVASAPRINISGFARFGFSNNGPQPRVDATLQYSDSFSKIIRGHNLKFGIDNRRAKIINPFDFGNNGVFSFTNSTGHFASGSSLINFLTGVPTSYFQSTGALNAAKTEEYYSYAQDTWSVIPSVSITYGLGYQVDTPYRQLDNNGFAMVAFRPGRLSTVYPTAPPGILYTGDPGVPRGTVGTRWKNFGPRLGVVWSPTAEKGPFHWLTGGRGDFSIRAGGGIFYNVTEGEASLQFLGNPPLGLNSVGVNDTVIGVTPAFANPFTSVNSVAICPRGGQPVAGVCATGGTAINPGSEPNRFPAPGAPPIGCQNTGPTAGLCDFSLFEPFSINILDPKLKTPRTYNFNLTIERQIKKDLLLRAAYVGAQGRNLYMVTEFNPVDTLRCAATSGCPGLSPLALFFPGITPFDGTVYGSLGIQETAASSHYHSLQLSAEKRMSHGLFLRGTYTLSKSLDNSSGLEDSGNFNNITPRNFKRDFGFSGFDARHIAVITYDWTLPLPKSSNPVLKRVLEGWAIGGITSFQSGFAIPIDEEDDDNCLAGSGNQIMFYGTWCRPNLIGPIRKLDPRASRNNQFFDISAFAAVPAASGQIGTSPRNPLHGPGVNWWDFLVRKEIHLTESKYFELRGEFYNLWNHANFDIDTASGAGNINNASLFGRTTITRKLNGQENGARLVQLGLKLYF
jgi:hypothetical protein